MDRGDRDHVDLLEAVPGEQVDMGAYWQELVVDERLEELDPDMNRPAGVRNASAVSGNWELADDEYVAGFSARCVFAPS